ncbi:hypothetical protein KLF50_15055 (plasmid) [Clostridium perfringens]|uniref:sigma factor-like helix-turn-helix DNA-binding protein n=1 Tax=Clostridium perfringens TaxID=1502 RepID=UPI001CCE6051|nr:sigma factor-like helix-turn-helix DNA-binding protein [Clostridium perfringens]UBK83483.1 hypothetical protein KLF50_15055 [Clostridium perfringens]
MTLNLDVPYTLKEVLGAMTNRYKLQELAYHGGEIEAPIILLADVEDIINKAKLTKRQLEVVDLYFYNQLTQEATAKILNISQQAVQDYISKIKCKLAKVINSQKAGDRLD